MCRVNAPLRCLLLFLALAPSLTWAEGQWGSREVMADAMVRMMEAMGMFDSSPSGTLSSNPFATSGPFAGSPWPPGYGGYGMPWMGRGGDSSLQGIWEGRDGELVVVQGERFRIYSSQGLSLDGWVRVQGDRLAMYVPGEAQARGFQFSESRGRLLLRDRDGQVYLYRRLRLDEPDPGTPSPGLIR